jgi:hypothetical protein
MDLYRLFVGRRTEQIGLVDNLSAKKVARQVDYSHKRYNNTKSQDVCQQVND